ncbi:MAG: PilT/PilU family type 4a pilus ATPase, partial [Deltaproteobacteria bacterium]|nr:PilT/PilU family type 4a pilus ATPase [Deltaproteobacteria bacterium]
MRTLKELLSRVVEKKGSDLHISAGSPPRLRLHGELIPLENEAIVGVEEAKRLCLEYATENQQKRLNQMQEIDFSFGIENVSRFRANVYAEKESIAGAFRALPLEIPDIEKLGLPPKVKELVNRPNGLVLVTGATGSGKSTTIASILNQINKTRKEHLITIEDPIEYIFNHGACMVHQREVGLHTESFQSALKYILRQDPDIVLVGEMRDLETIQAAITTAETGHLVFATLHTNSTVQTVDRIIDVFPPNQQPQVRSQLAFILEAILCQQLIPIKGGGRKLAIEMLFPNYAIRNLIREGKTHQMYAQMQSGQEKTGMRT